ncbi:MAG TPA: ATP-binding protein [Acidimicrobiales bacterium]|nr:ATP-binding protein [Acidimicrobiales bacterium]
MTGATATRTRWAGAAGSPPSADVAYLLARVDLVRARAALLVDRFRASDPAPDDPFRGLYVSEDQARWMAADGPEHGQAAAVVLDGDSPGGRRDHDEVEEAADHLEADGVRLRLRLLADRAGLSPLDVELLVIGAAPDLDRRLESVYGYLNDDVSRRRASVSLAMTLVGRAVWDQDARSRLRPGAPLVRAGLITVEDEDRPVLGRALRVPERVVSWLLGGDDPDPRLEGMLRRPGPPASRDLAEAVAHALDLGVSLIYLREGPRAGAAAALSSLAAERPLVTVDLAVLAELAPGALEDLVVVAAREALLGGGALAVGPLDAVLDRPSALRRLAQLEHPVVLFGRCGWEPSWTPDVPLLLDVPPVTAEERRTQLRSSLAGAADPELDPVAATAQFRLTVEQLDRAARAALLEAHVEQTAVTARALRHGARAQNSSGLERLARRIEPTVGWEDLVLAPASLEALRELAIRARQRERVLDGWRMRPGGGRGRGVTSLFAGDPGTGKTMSAEVLANALGMDLYVVSLPTVVDKYVGETEKNLERIFSEADGVNGILLFDEADAIFGRRSEVRDANDRFANMETAYLLQRVESFDGLAVLTTNLRANLDEAFARRLDVVVDFPLPDAELRLALWERCLGPLVPRAADLDLEFCARAFEMSGGSIRSSAVTAAYQAAHEERPVGMADVVVGIQREYRKIGRLIVAEEFGRYFPLLARAGR